jgi:hypothetical protein
MAKKIVAFVIGYMVLVGLFMYGTNSFIKPFPGPFSSLNFINNPMLFMVGIMVVFVAPILLFLYWFYHTPKWEKDLQVTGIMATARVLEMKYAGFSTGSKYNSTPWYRVKLQVQPSGDAPFEFVMEKSSAKLRGVYEGSTIHVKYDPNNKKHVVIAQASADSSSAFASFSYTAAPVIQMSGRKVSGSTLTQQLTDLSGMHQRGELTDEEFEAMKKQLLSEM